MTNIFQFSLDYKANSKIKMNRTSRKIMTYLIIIILFSRTSTKITKKTKPSMIYILKWLGSYVKEPFNYLERGQEPFVKRNCTYQNCYFLEDRSYFAEEEFDVIAFSSVNMNIELPVSRKPSQIYVFVALEPAAYYPLNEKFNGFFNMTWTYKLSSDVVYPYLLIKNRRGETIGPKINMQWNYRFDPRSKDFALLKEKLSTKTKAGVWLVSNCRSSLRKEFIYKLIEELKPYGKSIDIYGLCGQAICPRGDHNNECNAMIETDYFFYLALENSFCEDYVTEKILRGLQHFTVPIVFGGADYTRFMPPGSYLNGHELGPKRIAEEMDNYIETTDLYYDFFKWHGHYTYFNTDDNEHREAICGFCETLNHWKKTKKRKVYHNMSVWWNEAGLDRGYPSNNL